MSDGLWLRLSWPYEDVPRRREPAGEGDVDEGRIGGLVDEPD